MKHRAALLIMICLLIAGISAPVSGAAPVKAETAPVAVSGEQIKASRFLNMLNHNYNYNEDFTSVDTMVNNSVISLLDLRDEQNEDFIRADYVTDYVMNMYGIDVVDVSALNADWPQADGYIYIIPRCYNNYKHEYVSATVNEDGSTTVYSKVTVEYVDGETSVYDCVSLFVPNDTSDFGYSLIKSDIVYKSSNI